MPEELMQEALTYRSKPTDVQAIRWDGPWHEIPGVVFREDGPATIEGQLVRFYVVTLHEQRAYLTHGDWIITEPDGVHHYPVKPSVFAARYEELKPPPPPPRGLSETQMLMLTGAFGYVVRNELTGDLDPNDPNERAPFWGLRMADPRLNLERKSDIVFLTYTAELRP